MGKVKDIVKTKGSAVFSVSPSATVYEAIELMCEKNIGGLMITENGKAVGIFTERDYARKVILKNKSSRDTKVGEIMTTKLFTVSIDDSVQICMQVMTDKKIRHLPVMDGENVAAVISIGDVVRFLLKEQQDIIDHLEHYITSS
jgi:CBS domain-containing protein